MQNPPLLPGTQRLGEVEPVDDPAAVLVVEGRVQALAVEALQDVLEVLGRRLLLGLRRLPGRRCPRGVSEQLEHDDVAVLVQSQLRQLLLQRREKLTPLVVRAPLQARLYHPGADPRAAVLLECGFPLSQHLQDLADEVGGFLIAPAWVRQVAVEQSDLALALLLEPQLLGVALLVVRSTLCLPRPLSLPLLGLLTALSCSDAASPASLGRPRLRGIADDRLGLPLGPSSLRGARGGARALPAGRPRLDHGRRTGASAQPW
mmetsp:Transcript_101201/g.263891  ORF Transcript_101201/g.263891 Transcript_101201/m.263891 type:complete len:261 (-) Transcript_101201:17-799(-)